MRMFFIIIVLFFFCIASFSQNNQAHLHARIVDYLIGLNNGFKHDSVKYFLVKFICNKKGRITNTVVYFTNQDRVSNIATDSYDNLISDSLCVKCITYTDSGKKNLVLLPVIIKKVNYIGNPSLEKEFTASDIEKIFSLLQFVNLFNKKHELLDPIIAFHEDSMH